MHANSTPVRTAQQRPHEDLARQIERALGAAWQRPIAEHTRQAFEQAQTWRAARTGPLILDAGCGVGLSTRELARRQPDHSVIGIDRSAERLGRDLSRSWGELPDNALLLRADLVDFWRLALAAGWQPEQHYLLYPNPWPKVSQLKRRWQGHPVLPTLLALGGTLELRSNWRIYVEEFAQAIELVCGLAPLVEWWQPEIPMTPFERKYKESGQSLWRLVCRLPHRESPYTRKTQ
ncbi:tRNA (guanine(46)-N(7))-methyltransferase TrmB [Kushneria phosphatilytica]|uniref:tRNA (guanine(46)-N(7))-methyltransferase n=1 Tax=Kushneria phosphatilytica TaxID=657387 RepID=A0A1S1NLP7_9GAMM|nr:methyltransferase domain-containing protein [Kushneria phosphatilytica]OHV07671.1 SAM-dependent methyltransferase [Kushneria phosphatilytica]QEL10167.1 SAM-dependent methyltransferase [Kushneria phosphatilytica]